MQLGWYTGKHDGCSTRGRLCQLLIDRFAQATSLATLIVTGALICAQASGNMDYVAAWTAIPLIVIPFVNIFSGVTVCFEFSPLTADMHTLDFLPRAHKVLLSLSLRIWYHH